MDPVRQVAVLFARRDSVYKGLKGCDVWDEERDARLWAGGAPVVAHPPCRAWASLRHKAKPRDGEKALAPWAVEMVRRHGGVLEHPQLTTLWRELGLPEGTDRDEHGGWTLYVHQHWWGHRARKATRLYVCGVEPTAIPAMPLVLGEASHTVGLWSGRDKTRCRPSISKKEFEATPHEFAEWLVELARRCYTAAQPPAPRLAAGEGAAASSRRA